MKKAFSLFMALFFAFTNIAWAAAAEKPAKDAIGGKRESIVLLPVKGTGLLESDLSLLRDSIAEGLSGRYTVKFGEQVDRVIKEIFESESKERLECDESRCYKDIAAALNVQLVAKATVAKAGNNYQLSFVVYNVLENRAEATKTGSCKECGLIELSDKVRVMAGGEAPTAEIAQEEKKGTSWWWYLLGALAAGGIAAAAGGKSGGGSSSPAPGPSTAPATVSW